jgi:hypothetical protein
MAVDYLKTYLGIDPDDYSSMEARIRGEEPQAQAPVMMRQPMMMPQARSLGEMEAMPMAPRSQPTPQVDDRYQSLMDEIASLKAQIEGLQAPTEQAPVMAEQVATEQAPVMVDEPVSPSLPEGVDAGGRFYTGPNGENMYQPPMPKIGPGQFQAQVMPTPINLDTGMPINTSLPILSDMLDRSNVPQAPVGIESRMIDEPVPFVAQEPVPFQTQAPSQDIQASIDYLAKLPKMNIPQIPDIEQIRQKMEEANMTFPEPVSYQDQLQAIKDLPKITQMPTREEIQTAMQNIPTAYDANVTQNPFQKINDILPQSTIDQFQAVASKPNNFMGDSARNVMSQIQQPQMQSFGRPQLPFQGGFMPEMRASGGGIDKAIYDLKFKLNGR